MTWITPVTQVNGHIVTPAEWNGQVVGNLLERRTSVVALNAGTSGISGTYALEAPEAGNYIIEFGCGTIDTVTTGSTLQLASNKGGAVTYSDTGASGGQALVTGVALNALEQVVVTCTSISGSASATLHECWIKLTRTP